MKFFRLNKKKISQEELFGEFPDLPPVTESNVKEFSAWLSTIANTLTNNKQAISEMQRDVQSDLEECLEKLKEFDYDSSNTMRSNSPPSFSSEYTSPCQFLPIPINEHQEQELEKIAKRSCPEMHNKWQGLKSHRDDCLQWKTLLKEIEEQQTGLKVLQSLVCSRMGSNKSEKQPEEKITTYFTPENHSRVIDIPEELLPYENLSTDEGSSSNEEIGGNTSVKNDKISFEDSEHWAVLHKPIDLPLLPSLASNDEKGAEGDNEDEEEDESEKNNELLRIVFRWEEPPLRDSKSFT